MYRLRGRPAVHAAAARRKTGCNGVYGRHVWPDVCRHGSCVLSESFFWGTVAGSDVRPGIPPGCKFIWRKHHEVFPYGQPGLPAVSVPLVRPRPGRGQPEDLQHHRSGGCRYPAAAGRYLQQKDRYRHQHGKSRDRQDPEKGGKRHLRPGDGPCPQA